jgi:hypothetical protein
MKVTGGHSGSSPGMFYPSARPCVQTMAFPLKKFEKIIGCMEESFLITMSWTTLQKKIEKSNAAYKKE